VNEELIMKTLWTLLLAAALPAAAAAQEDVNRRSYNFLENHLRIDVLAEAAGSLHVVRGEHGRLEVAGRTAEGFTGSALGGRYTRELRLTAVGAESVEYLVVVPEHVTVRVHLPDGTGADLGTGVPGASWSWSTAAAPASQPFSWSGDQYVPGPWNPWQTGPEALQPDNGTPLQRTVSGGLFVAHEARWAPALVEVPDLSAIRSLEVRFQGADFRIAGSRPMALDPGDAAHFVLHAAGEPVDLVIFVPWGTRRFALSAGGQTIAEAAAAGARALCGPVVVQHPSAVQTWLTFQPGDGRMDCR
jgi:hypothetical protein